MEYQNGISVIIPVYNAEKYIKTSITSLMVQTFKDLELIFVVDKKNSDNSEEILKSMTKELKNVKIVKPQNGSGAGYNRNCGLKEVSKDYIGFVDADDFISKDFYEKLYNNAQKYHSDIAMGDNIIFYDFIKRIEYHKYPFRIESNLGDIYSFLPNSTIWDKIYRTELIKSNGINFPDNVAHEDNIFLLNTIIHANKLVTTPNAIYYWRRNKNSVTISSLNTEKWIDDGYFIFNETLDILYSLNITIEEKLTVIKQHIKNYADDVIMNPKYRNYFLEKLKIIIGKQIAYEIFYKLENAE